MLFRKWVISPIKWRLMRMLRIDHTYYTLEPSRYMGKQKKDAFHDPHNGIALLSFWQRIWVVVVREWLYKLIYDYCWNEGVILHEYHNPDSETIEYMVPVLGHVVNESSNGLYHASLSFDLFHYSICVDSGVDAYYFESIFITNNHIKAQEYNNQVEQDYLCKEVIV